MQSLHKRIYESFFQSFPAVRKLLLQKCIGKVRGGQKDLTSAHLQSVSELFDRQVPFRPLVIFPYIDQVKNTAFFLPAPDLVHVGFPYLRANGLYQGQKTGIVLHGLLLAFLQWGHEDGYWGT